MRQIAVFIFTFLVFTCNCNAKDISNSVPAENGTSDGIRIAWDYTSIQQIAEKGSYPRLLRLQDSSIIAIYESRTGDILYKRSYDDGQSWSNPIEVFSQFIYTNLKDESVLIRMANPEIIQLNSGEIVIGCNYRPAENEIAPFSIVVRRSVDNGATWLPPQALYGVQPRFTDGCWEPSFLELPNGELQVYFANENPYLESDEQEISMLSSMDKGATWTKGLKTVSFRKGRRDGMPVARILGDEIVSVIEDNNIDRFKPYTVRSKLNDNWSATVSADSPGRDYALVEIIQDSVYMGAPYLLKLPSGETVISYQSNENRDSDWEYSTMEVAIGDKSARDFNRRTQPFDVPLDKEAKWNSLALWDSNTVVAFASSNFKSDQIAPWLIKGYIIPEIKIKERAITTYPIFIGAKGETNLRAGLGIDEGYLYVSCKIADSLLYASESETEGDGACIYFNTGKETHKIWSTCDGKLKLWKKQKNIWISKPADKIEISSVSTEDGYRLEFKIPHKIISMSKGKTMRINMALLAYENMQSGYTEWIVNSEKNVTNTWLKIETE